MHWGQGCTSSPPLILYNEKFSLIEGAEYFVNPIGSFSKILSRCWTTQAMKIITVVIVIVYLVLSIVMGIASIACYYSCSIIICSV